MQDIPSIFTCDEHGTTISMKDIRVTIPPGAVPEGVVVNIEVNVTLYGSFITRLHLLVKVSMQFTPPRAYGPR